jgi:hypothetical protein
MTGKTTPALLNLLPSDAVNQPVDKIFKLLESQYEKQLYSVFENLHYTSPLAKEQDCAWIRRVRTVGINVRTIGNFWSVIPYSMTLPSAQQAIHLLPVFEPGVVSSLYGPTSWNINPEFFSQELCQAFPHLDTVEKQLSLVVGLLHLTGRVVGVDVIPHVDRYAEQSLANPGLFEWIRRKDRRIYSHHAELYLDVCFILHDYLKYKGSATPGLVLPYSPADFFEQWKEEDRLLLMFGASDDYAGRLSRRQEMVELLYRAGLETLPATMGPPYRGIEVDPDPDAVNIDEEGRIWRDYRFTNPGKFSRVFGPLTRYKLYEPKNNNADWELDFEAPNVRAWDYVCGHYKQVQSACDFDFMRGDMSHVQMRPEGTPPNPDRYYDLLAAVKLSILPEKPYFGYFAESFLAPPGEMAYGDECDHLEASLADSALGDLQSEPVGTARFVSELARYDEVLRTRKFAPNFTLMTADKDDPRFDKFYTNGNETRYFIGLFLTDMPSYMALGFECRDLHLSPAPNEHYTKLYVFRDSRGPKATSGPYIWGKNEQLYQRLNRQKSLSEEIFSEIREADTRWLAPPDYTGSVKVIAWTQNSDARYIFAANLDQENSRPIEFDFPAGNWKLLFSSVFGTPAERNAALPGTVIGAGECLVWKKA